MNSRVVVHRRWGISGRLGIVRFGILIPSGSRWVPILLWVLRCWVILLLGILGCRVILLGVGRGVSLVNRVLRTCRSRMVMGRWMIRGLMARWVHGTRWAYLVHIPLYLPTYIKYLHLLAENYLVS